MIKIRKDREASKRRSKAIKNNIKGLFEKFNSIRGQHDLDPIHVPIDKEFRVVNDGKTEMVKADSLLPTRELFSLAQELVLPKDEPFKAREVYFFDTSHHPGAREVGYDVLDEEGEAEVVATGLEFANIPRADISVRRNLNRAFKVALACKYLRDDILAFDLRNSRGFGPAVDLVSRKIATVRKGLRRKEDQLVWLGREGPGSNKQLQGMIDFFANTDTEADRGLGLFETVAAGVGGLLWSQKTADEIIIDLRRAREYIKGFNNAYDPNTLILDPATAEQIIFQKVSATSDRTILQWIREAFKEDGTDLKLVTTNAIADVNTGIGVEIFMLIDADRSNFAVALPQDITLLPPKEDAEGNVLQVMEFRIGGFQAMHGDAAYQGRGI